MSDFLAVLDQQPQYDDAWYTRLRRSLLSSPSEWLSAVLAEETMSDERGRNLLSWIRQAASEVVREPQASTLELAIFARALLVRSELDYRKISIVISLLRRGAEISGGNYLEAVSTGCARAGSLGEIAYSYLINVSAETPSTYEETGLGKDFEFSLRPLAYSTEELLRRIGDGKYPPAET